MNKKTKCRTPSYKGYMPEYNSDGVKQCYDLSAEKYAEKFLHELDGKPFDRNILDRFAKLIPQKARVFEMGCGPGHIGAYLHNNHGVSVTGLDYSIGMIRIARQLNPGMLFIKGDMLSLDMADSSVDAIIAFYSIVHFSLKDAARALAEFVRVLKPDALALFSFHTGNEIISVENFLDVTGAKATWIPFEPDNIVNILRNIPSIAIEDVIIRYPYEGKEYPSRRCYILFRKKY